MKFEPPDFLKDFITEPKWTLRDRLKDWAVNTLALLGTAILLAIPLFTAARNFGLL